MSAQEILDRAERGDATLRDGYSLLERLQQEADLLERLDENLPAADQRVVIRVDGSPQLFRFSNIDALADWLAGGWQK